MARKSRKEQQLQALLPQQAEPETVAEEASPVKWKVAMYARLSITPPFGMENDSIENQFSAITDYVSGHEDMEIAGAYPDNGYSGTNFTRPGFLQMLKDMEKGKFNCLIIKDFSRLGRHYLDMDRFLSGVFPDYGVRVISILDGYDSLDGDSNMMAHAMKNILNDYFCKDSGRKSSTIIRERKSQGLFSQTVPYGYFKHSDQKGLLLMDTQTAPAVYLIFAWSEQGANDTEIARYLDDLHFLRPNLQALAQQGISPESTVRKEWYGSTVDDILINDIYAGDYTYRITTEDPSGPNMAPRSNLEEYATIPDHHVPYLKRNDYDRFCQQRQKRHEKYVQEKENGLLTKERDYPFIRLVYCGECRHQMQLIRDQGDTGTLSCRGHFARKAVWHKPLSITVETLTEQVLQTLRGKQQEAVELTEKLEQVGSDLLFQRLREQCAAETDKLAQKATSNGMRKRQADCDLDSGILDGEIWQMQMLVLSEEQISLKKEYALLEERQQDIADCERLCPQTLKALTDADLSAGLSSPTAHRLIDRIDIFGDMRILITLKNGMQLQKLKEYLAGWDKHPPNEV